MGQIEPFAFHAMDVCSISCMWPSGRNTFSGHLTTAVLFH